MPRGDGTGPQGKGSGTGRGMGNGHRTIKSCWPSMDQRMSRGPWNLSAFY
jgi:hypothetical protein